MKKISLMLAFVALTATASFAKGSIKKPTNLKKMENKALVETSCTVSVKTGKYNATITWRCDCTRREACDMAYKLAGALL
jgi:cell division inhibitor SulA